MKYFWFNSPTQLLILKHRCQGEDEKKTKEENSGRVREEWMLLTRGSGGPCGGYTSGRRGSDALWVVCRFRSGCIPSSLHNSEKVTVYVFEVLVKYLSGL